MTAGLATAAAERLRARMAAFAKKAGKQAGKMQDGSPKGSLHDFRVASRRLETSLRLWTRGREAKAARRRARTLRRRVGDARENEVLLDLLRTRRLGAAIVPQSLRWEWIRELAAREPDGSPRAGAVKRLAQRVEALAAEVTAEPDEKLIARSTEKFQAWRRTGRARLRAALASGDPEDLHAARLALKRWRYAAEERALVSPELASPRLEGRLQWLRAWQAALGDLCDRTTLVRFVERSGRQGRRLAPRLEAARLEAVAVLRRRSRPADGSRSASLDAPPPPESRSADGRAGGRDPLPDADLPTAPAVHAGLLRPQ